MSDYDAGILTWSEEQAALLRRLAAGEQLNEASVDWPNIIEEIETVGRNEWHAVESLLLQALLPLLKIEAWPTSRDIPHWRAEARLFRRQASRRYTASMRQKLDVVELYDDALAGVPESMDGQPPLPLPPACPLTLDELRDPSHDLLPTAPSRAAGTS